MIHFVWLIPVFVLGVIVGVFLPEAKGGVDSKAFLIITGNLS